MAYRSTRSRLLLLAFMATLAACDENGMAQATSPDGTTSGDTTGGTTGGGTTGGTTTGGTTTGGTTTGGTTTGGTTGGGTTGGTTTGGTTTGGTTTGGTTTGGTTTGGTTTGGTTTGGSTTGGTTGGNGTGNATQCFDPLFGVVGTRIVGRFRTTDGDSGLVITTDYEQLIGSGMLGGIPVMTATGPVVTSGASVSASTVTQYYQLDNVARTSTSFGVDTDTTAPIAIQTRIRFIPDETGFFDLNVGESYTETNTVETTIVTPAPAPIGPVTTVTSTAKTLVRTFLGLESVTVPAGTFTACKFEDVQTSTTMGLTSTLTTTIWNFNNGINIRTESDGDITELLSASINGVPIQ